MEGCIIPPATVRGALLLTGTPTVSAVSTPAVSTLHCISPALAVESTSVSAALNGNTICCTDRAASSRCFNQIVLHSSGSSIKSTAQPVYSIVVLVLMLYLFHLPDHFNSNSKYTYAIFSMVQLLCNFPICSAPSF